MLRAQLITIIVSILFLFLIFRLVVKNRLREEYAIVWLLLTGILVTFSFWQKGLRLLSDLVGVTVPANLVFTISIFIILVYLLHLSLVASKLQNQNKIIAQEMALLKIEMAEMKEKLSNSLPAEKVSRI